MGANFTTRVARFLVGGAVGGMISFTLLDPGIRAQELAPSLPSADVGGAVSTLFTHATVFGATIGLCVGACLVVTDELPNRSATRLLLRAVLAACVGAILGGAGGFLGQCVFSLLLLLNVILARTLGWCLLGMAAGCCPGIVSGSRFRTRLGAIGGCLGGGAGGLLFDLLALVSGNGSSSRAVGLVLLGAIVGAAVSLVEELSRRWSATILTGTREGRSFILFKPQTTLGRDELADIPLFGDVSVQKVHATLLQTQAGLQVRVASGCAAQLNAVPGTEFSVQDGDTLQVGKHRLRFSTRGQVASAQHAAPPERARANTVSLVEIIGGPHAGETYPLQGKGHLIGRERICAVCLSRDGLVSRVHAAVLPDVHGWRIEDRGSSNGTCVNGQPVSVHWLAPGDTIALGETILRVR